MGDFKVASPAVEAVQVGTADTVKTPPPPKGQAGEHPASTAEHSEGPEARSRGKPKPPKPTPIDAG